MLTCFILFVELPPIWKEILGVSSISDGTQGGGMSHIFTLIISYFFLMKKDLVVAVN